jgi:anti-anti-sigma factor
MSDLTLESFPIADIPNGIIIQPSGYIDTTNAPEIEKYIEKHLTDRKFKIAINLENVDFISSAGWGIFISEIRNIRENKGDLVLVNMAPDVYDVYELMEFSSIIKAFDSKEDASKYFKNMK